MNQQRAPGTTIHARNIIAAFVVALILFFLVRFLYHHWQEVSTFDFSFNYYYLALSFVVLFIFFFLRVYRFISYSGNNEKDFDFKYA